jgi:hypothetical protein
MMPPLLTTLYVTGTTMTLRCVKRGKTASILVCKYKGWVPSLWPFKTSMVLIACVFMRRLLWGTAIPKAVSAWLELTPLTSLLTPSLSARFVPVLSG